MRGHRSSVMDTSRLSRMTYFFKCFSMPEAKGAAVAAVYAQDMQASSKQNSVSPWQNPSGDIIHLLANQLKSCDRWKFEGRCLRLLNRTWSKTLNKHITNVKPHRSRRATLDEVVEHVKKFPSIDELDMSGCSGWSGEGVFLRLLSLSKLHTVVLSGMCVVDSSLEHLSGVTTIKKLGLIKTGVTDAGLGHLRDLPGICDLELRGLEFISNQALDVLSVLTALSSLKTISCDRIGDLGMIPIAFRKSLEHLVVIQPTVSSRGMSCLCCLTHLRRFSVSCANMTSAAVNLVSRMTNLTELVLKDLDTVGFPSRLSTLKNLKKVALDSKAGETEVELNSLMPCSQLVSLKLHRMRFTSDTALSEIANLGALEHLSLIQMDNVVDDGLLYLGRLAALTKLDLQCCRGVSDKGIRIIAYLTNLRELFLHNCDRVSMYGIHQLPKLVNLETLTLGPCVVDDSVKVLATMKELRRLAFVLCNRLTCSGLKKLKKLKTLEDLCLDWCEGVRHEFKTLLKMEFLMSLNHLGMHPLNAEDEDLKKLGMVAPALKVDDDLGWVWER